MNVSGKCPIRSVSQVGNGIQQSSRQSIAGSRLVFKPLENYNSQDVMWQRHEPGSLLIRQKETVTLLCALCCIGHGKLHYKLCLHEYSQTYDYGTMHQDYGHIQ